MSLKSRFDEINGRLSAINHEQAEGFCGERWWELEAERVELIREKRAIGEQLYAAMREKAVAVAKPKPKRMPDIRSLAMSVYDYIDQGDAEYAEWRMHEISESYGVGVLAEVMAEVERITPAMFRSACRHSARA